MVQRGDMVSSDCLSGLVDRRTFLSALAALPAGIPRSEIQEPGIPIVDTHIHLFDQTRPQGAPYAGGRPPGSTAPTLPSYPPRYRALARPLGIVGAIAVEASPWVEDNLWVLQVAQTDTMLVGVIGNLEPDKPEFAEYLDRYRKNSLFLGIRYGNLWGRDLTKQTENADFLAGIKRLADAGLVFETANPRISLLEAIVRITDKVPDLRVVLDHMPGLIPTAAEQTTYERLLAELGKRPRIFCKLSSVVRRIDGEVSFDVATYRDRLDRLVQAFGDDRVVYGSDWPNSDSVAPPDQIIAVVKQYVAGKSAAFREKYFWRNSIPAYRWVRRAPDQPQG
jgi:predicted TIM-barrel fold metal-dependent hydrolase